MCRTVADSCYLVGGEAAVYDGLALTKQRGAVQPSQFQDLQYICTVLSSYSAGRISFVIPIRITDRLVV